MTRVAVLGAGVIGKRLAAVLVQDADVTLAGIAIRGPAIFALARPDLPYYAADADAISRLEKAGISMRGSLDDLLDACDVIVDCGPSGTARSRAAAYRAHSVRRVFCGGERHPGLGPLVHSALNPEVASAATVRLLSCNTTALARVLAAVGAEAVRRLDATIVRCCTDSDKAGKGITNGVAIHPGPTHHAHDLSELVPGVALRTVAMTAPMTAGHVIRAQLRLADGFRAQTALDRLAAEPRISLLYHSRPLSTAELKAATDRRWHNRYELTVLPIAHPEADELDLWLALDNEAITLPEAVDVLRLADPGVRPQEARRRTNVLLGIPEQSGRQGMVHR